jgi:hypothetical protein
MLVGIMFEVNITLISDLEDWQVVNDGIYLGAMADSIYNG